jgi:hypothetical protein
VNAPVNFMQLQCRDDIREIVSYRLGEVDE